MQKTKSATRSDLVFKITNMFYTGMLSTQYEGVKINECSDRVFICGDSDQFNVLFFILIKNILIDRVPDLFSVLLFHTCSLNRFYKWRRTSIHDSYLGTI